METENKERTFNFFRFEDLRVYHKALDYVKWVHKTTEDFPKTERSGIIEAYTKSATNIAINIAEGSGRNRSQFIYYLKMAISSIRECVVLSTIAHQKGLLNIAKEEESRNTLMEISKMVGALIASLQRRSRQENEPDSSDSGSDAIDNDDVKDPNMY